ncbi:MAG: helix-turn-helix transcriptional regulator, partial [Gammaproteobacteria bacterium]|nr:helix-turn-helix transcriptional regulator [Gammaproteobacteria bacterium]
MNDQQTPFNKAFAKIDTEKRLRVLDTATKVFAEKGFVGANINIIAREAGVSIGAMYNYFDTKENLFLTV